VSAVPMNASTKAADDAAGTRYQRWLFSAFALFNALRVVSYFPTFWAIHASGDSSQHSLMTWFVWSGKSAGWTAPRPCC
jgi:hypothetical protein